MRRLRLLVIALVVLALGLGGWRLYLRQRGTGVVPAAPSFTATVFGNGSQIAFPANYAGNWVWLMFSGADWPYCHEALLQLQQRQADLKALNISLVVVAEQDLTARQALTALGSSADIPILMGTTSVYDDYLVAGVPANYLIDPKGRMVTQVAGWVETLPDRWFQIVKDVGTK